MCLCCGADFICKVSLSVELWLRFLLYICVYINNDNICIMYLHLSGHLLVLYVYECE